MKKNKKGFTVVELVIVIGVIAVLSAILIPTFVSLTNRARETATQSNLNNAYKEYQVDALASGDSIKYLEKDEVYLSNEKNSIVAKDDVYHFVDDKWKKASAASIHELDTVYNGFDYQAKKYSGFYAFGVVEKLTALSIVNPFGSDTISRYTSVTLVAQPEPAKADGEVTWVSSDESKVSITSNGVINTVGEVGQSATITAISVSDPTIEASLTVTIGAAPSIDADEVKAIELPQFVNEYNANTSSLDNPAANNSAMANLRNGLRAFSSIRRGVFYANEEGGRDPYRIGVRNTFRFPYLSRTSSAFSHGVSYCGPFLNYEIFEKNGTGDYVATDKIVTDGYNIGFSSAYLTAGEFGQTFKLRVYNAKLHYEFVFETFDGYNIYRPEELCLFDNRDLTKDRLIFQDGSETNEAKTNSVWLPGKDYWEESRNGISSDDVKGIALHGNMILKNHMIPDGLKYTEEEINTYISTYPNDYKQWCLNRSNHYANIYGDYSFDGKSELVGSLKDDTALFYRTTNGESFRFEGNYFTVDASQLKPMLVCRTSNYPDPTLTGQLNAKFKIESHLALFGANLTNNSGVVTNSGSLSANSVMEYLSGTTNFRKPTRGGEIIFNDTAFIGNGDLSNDERYGGGLLMFKASAVTVRFNNNIVTKSYMAFMPQPAWYIVSDQINQVNGISNYHAWDTKFILDRVKCYRSYNIMFSAYGTSGNEINNSYFEDAGGPLLMVDELNYGKHNNTKYGTVDKAYYHTASIDVTDSFLRNYVQGTESWFVQYPLAGTLLGMVKLFGVDGGILYKNSRNHGAGKNIVAMQNNVPVLNFIGLDVSTSANIVENYIGTNGDISSGDALEGHIRITNTQTSNVFALDMNKVNSGSASADANLLAYHNVILSQIESSGENQQALMFTTSGGGHGLLCDGQGRNAAVYVDGLVDYVLDYIDTVVPGAIPDSATREAMRQGLNQNLPAIMQYYGGAAGAGDLDTEFFIPEAMFDGSDLAGLKTVIAAGITSYLNMKRDNLASGDYCALYINMAPTATHYFGVLFGLM